MLFKIKRVKIFIPYLLYLLLNFINVIFTYNLSLNIINYILFSIIVLTYLIIKSLRGLFYKGIYNINNN